MRTDYPASLIEHSEPEENERVVYGGRSRYGQQDVGAKTMRFDYMDRMGADEHHEAISAYQSAEEWKASLPPVIPDREIGEGSSKVKVYFDDKAREINRRESEAHRIRQGGKQ